MSKKLHLEILDAKRQKIFSDLHQIFSDKYYLAGGTALALQIGHRESLDFDLFCNQPVSFAQKSKLIQGLRGYNIQTLVDTGDELSIALDKSIKITLLNYFWDPMFSLVRRPKTIPLLSVKDIATTKAYALGRRGNYRDYFDLYVIINGQLAKLPDIIRWCKKKYGDIFSERMFLEQLVYLGDVAPDRNLRFLAEKYVSPQVMEKFFSALVDKQAKR